MKNIDKIKEKIQNMTAEELAIIFIAFDNHDENYYIKCQKLLGIGGENDNLYELEEKIIKFLNSDIKESDNEVN